MWTNQLKSEWNLGLGFKSRSGIPDQIVLNSFPKMGRLIKGSKFKLQVKYIYFKTIWFNVEIDNHHWFLHSFSLLFKNVKYFIDLQNISIFCVLWAINYILCYILAGNNVSILSTGTAPRHGSRGRRSSIEIDKTHESNLKGNVDIWLRIFLPDPVRSDIDMAQKMFPVLDNLTYINWLLFKVGSCFWLFPNQKLIYRFLINTCLAAILRLN